MEVLLNHGADLAVLDADGNTPMNLCTDADILHLMSKEVSSASALVCVRACVCVLFSDRAHQELVPPSPGNAHSLCCCAVRRP